MIIGQFLRNIVAGSVIMTPTGSPSLAISPSSSVCHQHACDKIHGQPHLNRDAGPGRELTAVEKAIISYAIDSVLQNPDSAKFRWARLASVPRNGATEYCTLINAKNSFGTYVGFNIVDVQLHYGKADGQAIKLLSANVVGIANQSDEHSKSILESACLKAGYSNLDDSAN